jgi:preprotein translocase subunit SecF
MSEDISWLNVVLLISIICIAVGAIWIVSSTIGPFLAPQYWLLIIGAVGLFGIYIFAKYRE